MVGIHRNNHVRTTDNFCLFIVGVFTVLIACKALFRFSTILISALITSFSVSNVFYGQSFVVTPYFILDKLSVVLCVILI